MFRLHSHGNIRVDFQLKAQCRRVPPNETRDLRLTVDHEQHCAVVVVGYQPTICSELTESDRVPEAQLGGKLCVCRVVGLYACVLERLGA